MATPARNGQRWTTEEETSILACIEAGMTVAQIADAKQRTRGSIRSRLTRIACSFVEEKKMSLYEASGRTGIRVVRIQEALKQKMEQEKAKATPVKMDFNFTETFTRERLRGRAEEMKRHAEAAERLRIQQNVQMYVNNHMQRQILDAAAKNETSYLYDLTVNRIGGCTAEDIVRGLREKFPECTVTLTEEWVEHPSRHGQPPTRVLKSGIKIDWS